METLDKVFAEEQQPQPNEMSDIELISIIENEERTALGYYNGQIASEQAKALQYYYGQMDGDEEGYSSAQSSDVWDVVEGMTPAVLKPFVASDDILTFSPFGAEDVQAAEQESDYVNYVATQKNDIFEQMVMWVKTGLLQKNGVVKYWWEKSQKVTAERYDGLSEEELLILYEQVEQSDNIEIVGASQYDGGYSVELKITNADGYATYSVVPPEEFLISRDARSPNPKMAKFVQHRQKLTLSKLREMGYDVTSQDVDLSSSSDAALSQQAQARYNSEEIAAGYDDSLDDSMQETLYRETYINVDYDMDGIAELRKVCLIGNKVFANEEVDEIPFAGWTPYPQPFKFYGRCPADEVIEVQEVKTTLIRQNLNNIYTINNNRTFISDGVNVDDMINNALAGIIRVKKGTESINNHVYTAPIQPLGGIIQPQIEYWDSAKENRTGFTRYNQGMDANSLNQTARGISIITEQSNQKMELVARNFANGLKALMLGLHGLCRKHGSQQEIVRLRNKFVPVSPRDWKERYDMRISVGLGHADKQMQMQGVQMLLNAQKEQVAGNTGLVQPNNLYAGLSKFIEVLGFKDYQKYLTDPSEKEPAPPVDPMSLPENVFKAKELELKKMDMEMKDKDRDEAARLARIDHLFRFNEVEKSQKEAQLIDGEIEEKANVNALVQSMALNMQAMESIMLESRTVSESLIRLLAAPKKIILDEEGMPIGTQIDTDGILEE